MRLQHNIPHFFLFLVFYPSILKTERLYINCALSQVRKINNELKSLSEQVESLDHVLSPSKNIWKISMMECIICKKEMHLMCSYCVTNQASQIVKDNLRRESSIKNFHESFNTDLYDYELNRNSMNAIKR